MRYTLFLLRPKHDRVGRDVRDADPWEPWYNKKFGFVIRASSEREARTMASGDCGAEGEEAWLNPNYSTCIELIADGDAEIIIEDEARA